MVDCIFCKIAAGEIPSEVVYQDESMMIFKDINPQAPVHLIIIPKKHIASVDDLTNDDAILIGKIFLQMKEIVKEYSRLDRGYRIICNTGKESGQTVFHIHFHLIGGRHMGWPPG